MFIVTWSTPTVPSNSRDPFPVLTATAYRVEVQYLGELKLVPVATAIKWLGAEGGPEVCIQEMPDEVQIQLHDITCLKND